jgi:hypothetical protein
MFDGIGLHGFVWSKIKVDAASGDRKSYRGGRVSSFSAKSRERIEGVVETEWHLEGEMDRRLKNEP